MKKESESQAHKLLKEKAVEHLQTLGCSFITTEYRIFVEKKLYRVDVVGTKDNERIAIECGRTKNCKIQALKQVFTKVLRFPYSPIIYPKKQRLGLTQIMIRTPITTRRIEAVSKLFQRRKIQLPAIVCKSLNVKDGEKIIWILQDEKWVVEKA